MRKSDVLKQVSPRNYDLIEEVMNSGVYCSYKYCARKMYPGRGYQCHLCWRAARDAIRVMRRHLAQ